MVVPVCLALRLQFPDLGSQFRYHLEQVADDAVGGDLEDGGLPVAVDGDDHVRILHAHQVLDGPGDAAGDVDLGPYGLAGLPYLAVRRQPAGIHRTARSANHAAQFFGQFPEQAEVVLGHQAASAGYDEFGPGNIDVILAFAVPDYLQDLGEDAVLAGCETVADNLAAGICLSLRQWHDLGSYRGHLGPEAVAHDGGHDVAAKGGAGLHQVALVVDRQSGTVGGQAGLHPGGHCSCQVAPHPAGTPQDYFWLVLVDLAAAGLQIRFGAVMPVDRMVEQVGFCRAIAA